MNALAVVLGVAFVAGFLVFTDTLDKTFTELTRNTAPDVTVRPVQTDTAKATGDGTGAVTADMAGFLAALPGVGPSRRVDHRPGHLRHRQQRQGDRRRYGTGPGRQANERPMKSRDVVTVSQQFIR